jgi:hypothetical protein
LRAPAERSRCCVVWVGVPERAIVGRFERHIRVVNRAIPVSVCEEG